MRRKPRSTMRTTSTTTNKCSYRLGWVEVRRGSFPLTCLVIGDDMVDGCWSRASATRQREGRDDEKFLPTCRQYSVQIVRIVVDDQDSSRAPDAV
jgi:hypothetical protein